MLEDRLCATCSAWMCRGDDAWCGYCGAGCAALGLAVVPSTLEIEQIAPPLCFQLTNPSCADLALHAAKMPNWISLRAAQLGVLPAGATTSVWAGAGTLEMREPAAEEVTFSTPAGTATVPLLVLSEKPKVILTPGEIVSWSGGGRKLRSPVSIAPTVGKLRILGVRAEMQRQLLVSGFRGPMLASRTEPVKVEVGVDDERLLPMRWPPSLVVVYEGPHGDESLVLPLPVVSKQPPQLKWEDADSAPAVRYSTERQRLDLVFSNRDPGDADGGGDNADLVLESVTLTAPPEISARIECTSSFPLTLGGGAREPVGFLLNLERAGEAQGRLVHFQLEVQSNNGRLSRKMPLRLEPLRPFDGVVAIDFGSSNTCCAILRPGDKPAFLMLDEQRAVSPTIVRYIDVAKIPPETEIGTAVKALAARSDEVAASTVRQLKQGLGKVQESLDVRPKNSEEWVTRRASEAAADYLREIRRVAEAQENAIFWDFVLTHPARCPLRQYRRMREALEGAFGREGKHNIEYLQEPIAALIPFFVRVAELRESLTYTAASFDLGGGTTDVAVVRVQQTSLGGEEVEIVPEILLCRGISFGGEDLTDYLERELQVRCVAALHRDAPGAVLLSGAIEAKADVLMNSAALREAADALKASLSEEASAPEPRVLSLRVRKDGIVDFYPFQFAGLCMEGGADLRTLFLRYVGEQVQAMTALLQPAAGQAVAIDKIQLSGKTAFLPVVGETLRRAFPAAEVDRAAEPKECVVYGACLYRSLRHGSLRLVLPATQRMTSSIGLWLSRTSPFVPILRMDTEIPQGGLERIAPLEWDGFASIVLWENVGPDEDDPVSLRERKLLVKLGSWRPPVQTVLKPAPGRSWPIRLRLRDLRVEIAVLPPTGVPIVFLPMHGVQP